MKAAWRIRRIALQGGLPKRQFVPLRFASTAAAPAPHPAITPTSSPSTPPAPIYQPNQAGPSNYASRPAPPQMDEEEPSSDFFTSHRPDSTPLQDTLASYSSSDDRIQASLREHLYPTRDAVRDENAATGVWRRYLRLSPSARSAMDYKTLQNILRAVVPSTEHLEGQQGGRRTGPPSDQAKTPHAVATKYGERMRRILQDMEAVALVNEDGSGPRPSDYRFTFRMLAQVGDSHAAESLADSMRTRDLRMDIRMVDSRLSALCEWLHRSVPGSLHGARAARIPAILWQILGDISTFELTPRNVTTTLLLQAVYAAKGHTTTSGVLSNLDVVLEDVCAKAYGVDMRYLTLGAEKEERLKGSHVYALVDYWGRKADVWKMLSTYEVLTEEHVAAGPGQQVAVEEEEEIPTLSGMMKLEAEDRRGMTIFGKRKLADASPEVAQQAEEQGRDLSPHLQAPTYEPTFSTFFPESHPSLLASAYPPTLTYPHTRMGTETISILIRHTVSAGDMQLLNHILASALASVRTLRAEWLAALQLRHARTGGDPSHVDWFRVPGPRLAVDHQWFWDVEVFARKSDATKVERLRFEALVQDAQNQLSAERVLLEGLRRTDAELAAMPRTFNPARHLEMIDGVGHKLEVILERTQEGMEKKRLRDAVRREGYKQRRQERMAAAELEKTEAMERKKRARAATASVPPLAPAEMRHETAAEDVKVSSGWSEGDNGVRMIGIA